VKARGLRANSTLAFLGDAASKVAALVVLLVAARLFSIDEFAVVATGLACATLLTTALDIGAGTLLARDGAVDPDARGALFRALLVARTPLAIAVVLVALLLGLVLKDTLTVLMVVAFALSGALTLSVLGLYRSCGDIAPEAIARVAAACLSVLAVFVVGLYVPRADVLLGALALAALVPLLPLLVYAPRVADLGLAMSSWDALRRAAPIGMLALFTVAYYRTGTIALALLADPRATATFGVASTLAFGLLLIPNAITTALLPRLAADRHSGRGHLEVTTRRALVWTLAIAVPVTLAASAIGPSAIPAVFGSEYDGIGLPFVLLCLGIPVIAVSGVLGTALLAVGRLRALGAQVVTSLVVNVAVLLVLVPFFGAVGASLATLACEAVGLLLLLRAARRFLPDLLRTASLPVRRIDVPDSARP
jgi:O-antigen/teichoic acid export membrane protein